MVGQGLFFRVLVFHSKTLPFDGHRFGVMEEPIQHGTGESGIVVEDFGPVFKGQISGDDTGTPFISPNPRL